MPAIDVDPERITVFHVGEEYLFSHYFEREDLFEALSPYYDRETYRFECSAEAFERVRELLADEHYELAVVEEIEPYCVVVEQYEPHADLLRESVLSWKRRGHRFLVMADELAVLEAVEAGATRLAETEFVLGI